EAATASQDQLSNPIIDFYRCPPVLPDFSVAGRLSGAHGFFRFGPSLTCYGQSTGRTSSNVGGRLFDASKDVRVEGGAVGLPFDVNQVVDNLRYERYVDGSGWQEWLRESRFKDIYYAMRPLFPIALRKHLQTFYLRGWREIPFPAWPVDRTVD